MQLPDAFSRQQLKDFKIPNYKRVLKKCDDFILCVNSGDAGYLGAGHPNLNYTLYMYTLKGKSIVHRITKGDGEYGVPFKYEYIIYDSPEGKLIDLSNYLDSYGFFEALEDFYYIGFNTLDKNIKWDGRLIEKNETELVIDKPNSYFVCLNDSAIINGKEFKRFDYAPLTVEKKYNIEFSDNCALGLFNKLG